MCERDSKLYFLKSITSCYGFVLDVVAIDWLDREKKKAPSMISYVQVASKGMGWLISSCPEFSVVSIPIEHVIEALTILQDKVRDILVVLDARVQLSFSECLVGSNPGRYYDSDDDDGDYLRTSLL